MQDLIIATDPVMEGQIVLGRNPIDSSDIVLDPGERVLYNLVLATPVSSSDLNGDEFVDLYDALIALSLFNTIP